MIQLDQIQNYFPHQIQDKPVFYKYMMKEYLQLSILDYLSSSPYIKKLAFIGGTNLRLIKGIDRFSEDLDFDCKNLSEDEFKEMTDHVLTFLKRNGYNAEAKDSYGDKLQAFRRSIYFPEFLFELGLSGHREERFLIKVESQDQKINYDTKMVNIKGCGFFSPMPVPPDGVLCAMKVSAMFDRKKGRDFYDAMFLLSQTLPDFSFLKEKSGVSNLQELKDRAILVCHSVNMRNKMRDFEHLLFNKRNSERILHIEAFFNEL